MPRVAPYVLALLSGLAGMALYLTAYHLYLDHLFVDGVRMQLQQQQQQQQLQQQASPPPPK